MNINPFKRRDELIAVDMDDLADRLGQVPALVRPADEFAPQRSAPKRIEEAIEQIESFLALPLKEIDETEAALKAEYEETMAKGQEIRDIIMAVRKDYLAQIERGRKVAGIAKETFATLADKIAALDAPTQDARPTYVKPKITEITADEARKDEP
jgi:hypothetical protein